MNMKKEEITHKIIGCAYKVYNELGFGFLESVYRKAMSIELESSGYRAEQEKALKVYYSDQVVGEFYIDILVDSDIILELKSVQHLAKEHEVQLVHYLNGMKKALGLLINFGPSGVEVKRKYRNPEQEEILLRQD